MQVGRGAGESQWIRETRFGTWFLSTEIWLRYVLAPAFHELARLLGPHRGSFESILDAGCGHGLALPLLEQRFHPEVLIGVDVDPNLIRRLEAVEVGRSCQLEIRAGDVTQLDVPDASMDMVFCHQTLHHLRDQEGALLEFFRVLKPGGALLLAESCRPFTRSLFVRALFRHPMGVQRSAEAYLGLVRAAHFELSPEQASTASPWWSRPDLGILARLGRPVPADPARSLVHAVAFRPSAAGISPHRAHSTSGTREMC